MSHAALLLAALIAEAALGYPRRWPHPVQAAGALIAACERRWNRGGRTRQRLMGMVLLATLVVLSAALGWIVERAAGTGRGGIAIVLVATTGLAQRSLHDHVAAVLGPLASGDLPVARRAVAMIVGRDTAALDEAGVATAAIESLSESFCDGVVAPAFWFLIAGLPGLFAAKAINTADSMVGHRTARLQSFGWACARADDGVNWVPARVSGVLICLAGRGGWRTMLRDARRHASPNGGWPEAAMAGALGRGAAPAAADLRRALHLYRIACLGLWGMTGAIAWAR